MEKTSQMSPAMKTSHLFNETEGGYADKYVHVYVVVFYKLNN